MNYIQHLNAVCRRFAADPSLNPTHISLYLALFQVWNISRFAAVIYINREELMKLSKIGSANTYHRVLLQLHKKKYIVYYPTNNPFKSSRVRCITFDITYDRTGDITDDRSSDKGRDKSAAQEVIRAVVSYKNSSKQKEKTIVKHPPSESQVIDFFNEKKKSSTEARKFFNHYQAVGWQYGGKLKIVDWTAAAEKWILSSAEFKTSPRKASGSDHLKTIKSKNYGEPL